MAGIVLAVPVAAQYRVAPDHFADESVTQPTLLAMTELNDQDAAPHEELGQNNSKARSGDRQRVSAASSDSANNNPSVSSMEARDKKRTRKKDKNKAKPLPSDQEEQFNRVLQGIYG